MTAELRKRTVLVIDDDPQVREMLGVFLAEEGCRPVLLSRAAGAWAQARRLRPDLVLLDLRLEHPNAGRMLYDLLRHDPATMATPVVITSADTEALQYLAPRLRRGGAAVLEKPFDLDQLRRAMIERLALTAG